MVVRSLFLALTLIPFFAQADIALPIVTKGNREVVRIWIPKGSKEIKSWVYTDRSEVKVGSEESHLAEKIKQLADAVKSKLPLEDKEIENIWKDHFTSSGPWKLTQRKDTDELRDYLAFVLDRALIPSDPFTKKFLAIIEDAQKRRTPEAQVDRFVEGRKELAGYYVSVDENTLKQLKLGSHVNRLLLQKAEAGVLSDPLQRFNRKSDLATNFLYFQNESEHLNVTSDNSALIREKERRLAVHKEIVKKVADTFWRDEYFFESAYGGRFRDINRAANKAREERDIAYEKAKIQLYLDEAEIKRLKAQGGGVSGAETTFARFEAKMLSNFYAGAWVKYDYYDSILGSLVSSQVISSFAMDNLFAENIKRAGFQFATDSNPHRFSDIILVAVLMDDARKKSK